VGEFDQEWTAGWGLRGLQNRLPEVPHRVGKMPRLDPQALQLPPER
jgi:hypothetical protein